MNSFVITLLAILMKAKADTFSTVIEGPKIPGVILQGPSTKTVIVGPDGSQISSAAIGGVVESAPQHTGSISTVTSPQFKTRVGYGLGVYGGAPSIYTTSFIKNHLQGFDGYNGYKAYHPIGKGSGAEGQWIPDNTEKLFVDGAYIGDHIPNDGIGLVYGQKYAYH